MLPLARKLLIFIAAIAMATPISSSGIRAELPPLIPTENLLGNPERTSPTISPDSKHLGWLAPDAHDVLQVWVQTIGKNDPRAVTAEKTRGISSYGWAFDSKTILYAQDTAARETFQLFSVST